MGNARNVAFWVVLFLLVLALFNIVGTSSFSQPTNRVSYSEFIQQVTAGEVQAVQLDGESANIQGKDGRTYTTVMPQDATLTQRLLEAGVDVTAESQQQSGVLSLLSVWLPFIVLIGVWVFFMNRMQGGGKGGAMGFGKSRAKLLTE